MMGRVTQGLMINDFNSNLHSREAELEKTQKQLSSGYRVNLPSEDPVAAINYMDYDSRLKEVSVYKSIVDNAKSKINMTDSSLDSVTSVVQRLRELAVQGANGVYSKEERQNMAVEVDQLSLELLQLANTYYKGNALFGGTMTDEAPFKANIQTNPESGMEFLEDVRYIGNNQTQISEVERGEKIDVTHPGNQVFWADNMEMYSTLSVSGYTAASDSKIVVDGQEISIKMGDNLEVIADKINQSGTAVRASVQTKDGQSYFALESTSPHQISLMDTEGGNVLQDMGLIDHGMQPPYNYSPSARVYTGSIFDVMVKFRKALQGDDTFKIGGTALMGIDNSLANILKFRAHIGSVSQRLDTISERYLSDEVYLTDAKNNAIGTDISKAMMEMKMLEFSHDVALNIGSRILPKTLLDFLR
jgi:flagellar hook-associated protein 3 FlgL